MKSAIGLGADDTERQQGADAWNLRAAWWTSHAAVNAQELTLLLNARIHLDAIAIALAANAAQLVLAFDLHGLAPRRLALKATTNTF